MNIIEQIKRSFGRIWQGFVDRAMGTGLMQDELAAEGEKRVFPGMPELIRKAAAEGCVLLKNDGTLPLGEGARVAVFGRCQFDWFHVGYGSGGSVNPSYLTDLIDGLKGSGLKPDEELLAAYSEWRKMKEHRADHGWWGHWPMSHPEMPLSEELVSSAASRSDAALVVIGRAAGEDRENTLTEGSYYLTADERDMLEKVCAAFEKTVVILNVGSVMDMGWTEELGDGISALLIAWQGGMEAGNAASDLLCGRVSPSGRLSDSIARRWEDHPSSADFGGLIYNDYSEDIYVGYRYFDKYAKDRLLFPFGFGLSYTGFALSGGTGVSVVENKDGSSPLENKGEGTLLEISVSVKNTGALPGREVVQLWCEPPAGRLEKPLRVLAAFAKTSELAPGGSEIAILRFNEKTLSSYDEELHAFVMEKGEYRFYVTDGSSADELSPGKGLAAGSFTLDEEKLIEQCEPICAKEYLLRDRILSRLPEELTAEGEDASKKLSLAGVAEGNVSLDSFTASLEEDELEALTRGHGMMGSSLGTPGNAGAFGGIIKSLRDKGVPPLITADGPSGIRLSRYCSLLPIGTALACSWDEGLTEELYRGLGAELDAYGIDVLLAPGMNIHRNPLGGRNFEYFSEDPLLSGKTAAAVIRGIQSSGHAACPKHFACNNQETKRNVHDSRVSERALREIYLRNFEIAVKEGRPLTIMTSYNKINGVWSHYHYDMVTTVLRGEWGYDGAVLTDWWMQRARSPEFPLLRDNAYRVRAQVDVLMPGDMAHMTRRYRVDPSLRKTLGLPEGITKAELQRSAENVLRLVLRLKYGSGGKENAENAGGEKENPEKADSGKENSEKENAD